jgi:CheY-like chemotaxis protein
MPRRDAPLLAILDWSMPEMDGLEICRRLREAEKMVYIILLTARGSKETSSKGCARVPTIIWSSRSTPTNCRHGFWLGYG